MCLNWRRSRRKVLNVKPTDKNRAMMMMVDASWRFFKPFVWLSLYDKLKGIKVLEMSFLTQYSLELWIFAPKITIFPFVFSPFWFQNLDLGWLHFYRLGWVEFYRYQKFKVGLVKIFFFDLKLKIMLKLFGIFCPLFLGLVNFL